RRLVILFIGVTPLLVADRSERFPFRLSRNGIGANAPFGLAIILHYFVSRARKSPVPSCTSTSRRAVPGHRRQGGHERGPGTGPGRRPFPPRRSRGHQESVKRTCPVATNARTMDVLHPITTVLVILPCWILIRNRLQRWNVTFEDSILRGG